VGGVSKKLFCDVVTHLKGKGVIMGKLQENVITRKGSGSRPHFMVTGGGGQRISSTAASWGKRTYTICRPKKNGWGGPRWEFV